MVMLLTFWQCMMRCGRLLWVTITPLRVVISVTLTVILLFCTMLSWIMSNSMVILVMWILKVVLKILVIMAKVVVGLVFISRLIISIPKSML